ncbi:MAG TPA: DUF4259 domain-containing protein [Phycisphaerales bacterium]|nr:DUF4259 domain-containing protein [Phycisphaerales bacterium]
MGAWGTGIFENDDALDWVLGWQEAGEGEGTADEPGRISFVIGAMAVAVDHKGYLDVDAGGCALAAAEVVAAACGKPSPAMKPGPEADEALAELAAWVRTPHAKVLNDPDVRALARQAVDRACGPESEAAELWDESEHAAAWRAAVDDLRSRLA